MRATIIPTVPTLESYSPLNKGYHLILASVAKANPVYVAHYRALTDAGEFVILDNDAYEEGAGASYETLKALNEAIHPSEIVLPDVMASGRETFLKSAATLEAFRGEKSSNYPKFMGVPHGDSVKEWRDCADALITGGVDSIGMARMYGEDRVLGSLVAYLRELNSWLQRYKWDRAPLPIHLLGWSNRLEALSEVAHMEYLDCIYLRGVDSSKPLTYAYYGTVIDPYVPYEGRPEGYFQMDESKISYQIAKYNFRVFQRYASGV